MSNVCPYNINNDDENTNKNKNNSNSNNNNNNNHIFGLNAFLLLLSCFSGWSLEREMNKSLR